MPKSMTRRLEFSPQVRKNIRNRDQGCFFCRRGYHMEWALPGDLAGTEIMHIVPRSHLGLGVEENGVLGCRYHHQMMDNGNRGLRAEMIGMLKDYMQKQYPGWSEKAVTWRKWDGLKYG